jgi:hypothetical protein
MRSLRDVMRSLRDVSRSRLRTQDVEIASLRRNDINYVMRSLRDFMRSLRDVSRSHFCYVISTD